MERNLFTIILGMQAYGGTPEDDTAWARVYLMIGMIAGFVAGVAVGAS